MNPLHRSIFSWFCRNHQSLSRLKAPRIRPAIEHLEGRLNPAPVASLPQLLDVPHSLVVLSPDIASQVPVAEYAGARVLTLDPTRDAISQISDSLAGQSSLTSLRVIGHGQPGSLSLAGQTINLATLQARSVEVAAWASHLTPDADILLYGCSVASTAGGRAFVNTLANLTGADVAASTDLTGAGGNLTLEYTGGAVTDHLQASPQAWNKSGLQLPTAGKYNYDINSDGTSVTITGYTGSGNTAPGITFGAVTLPDTLGGLPVTAIGTRAFEGSHVRSVTILSSSSVTSIGDNAFKNCIYLMDVTISSSLKFIGNAAFADCSGLNKVTIPSSVTSIGSSAFSGCRDLPGMTIPSSVTFIGANAFNRCVSLTSVTIPPSVTSIGDNAFLYCTSLKTINAQGNAPATGTNVFANAPATLYYNSGTTGWTNPWRGLRTIGMEGSVYQFSINSDSTSVTITAYTGPGGTVIIPETLDGKPVTAIGSSAFKGKTNVTSVTIPSSVTAIGDSAFYGCLKLTSVTIPSSVKSIGGSAFYNCSSLTSVTIPDGVTAIGNYAFTGCSSLTSVTIPDSVTSIGTNAFLYCSILTAIEVAVANNDFSSMDGILFNKAQTTLIQCPGGKAGTYTIPEGVTAIGTRAFDSCVSLTSVTIPSSVTSIENSAFYKCSSLTSLTIPDGITSIQNSAFYGCSKLTGVTIPDGVKSIENSAFYNCSSLTSVTIPSSVTSIGSYAFTGCIGLTSVMIRDGVISIGDQAFRNCFSLTSVTIPSSVTSIGGSAFGHCTGLTRIDTLGNAPAVGKDAFVNVPATLYYYSVTTGWTNPWAGMPTISRTILGSAPVRTNPLAAPFSLAAGSTVASLGNGKIGIWSATGDYQAISPFPGYTGTLNVNTVNRAAGQNADSIVVAVAGRGSPHVLTIDSATGRVTSSFFAFDPGFLGGVTVAGGVTRIGGEITSVILCGAGSGSSPSVSVFNAVTRQPMGAFYAYAASCQVGTFDQVTSQPMGAVSAHSNQYLGGVRVALSEAGADGTSFAIIGSTINSHVVAFDLNDYHNPILSFHTFPDNLTPLGIYVASGDLDGDNLNEILVGAGQGTASPQVAVFDMAGKLKKSFNAFDMSFLGGVQVGVADYNKDGKLDILAAPGLGAPGTLNVFNYDNLALIDSVFISDSTLGFDVASNFSRG